MDIVLNGRINENGVIIALNDSHDIIYNKAEDSLLYRDYRNGKVRASVYLAEFADGEASSGSEAFVPGEGYGTPVTESDKTDRKSAIAFEMHRIIRFLEKILADINSAQSTKKDCRRVLARIRSDLSLLSDAGTLPVRHKDEPLALPLVF